MQEAFQRGHVGRRDLGRLIQRLGEKRTPSTARPPAIVRLGRDGKVPASFAQERLWFLDQLLPGRATYLMPAVVLLRGALDAPALRGGLAEMTRRHEVLRTGLAEVEGRAMQVIAPPSSGEVALPLVDLSRAGGRAEAEKLLAAVSRRPFALAVPPLWRAVLLRLEDTTHLLLLVLHHIVADGWSIGIFLRELSALYDGATLAELPVQYADYAAWQREWLGGEVLARALGFWRARLAGAPEVLELPADRARPAMSSGRGGTVPVRLSAQLAKDLRAFGRSRGATSFMVLLAGLQAVLSRLSGQRDVVVGTPIANRTRVEVEGLIGFFVNTLAVRTDLSGDPGFRELLDRVRKTTLEAYEHQELPFERLVEELRPERHLGETPLVQVMFVLQNAPFEAVRLRGVEWRPRELATGTSKFDLTLALAEGDEGFAGTLEYSADLFDRTTVQRLSGHWRRLLAAAVAEPDAAISFLGYLSPAERHQLAVGWNDTGGSVPERALHELFAAQASATPDAVALEDASGCLTYGGLERSSNRLARFLRNRGVAAETPVGLLVERSFGMVVATLAVLKAGGAYVPLDAAYPRERLALILEDSAAAMVVVGDGLASALPDPLPAPAAIADLAAERAAIACESEAPLAPSAGAAGLAYVMFTSGSTGRPKGVAVAHRSVVRLVGCGGGLAAGPGESFLQAAPISFDAATLEVWGPLLNGGRLVLLPAGPFSLEQAGAAVVRHRVSHLWLTAGLFHQMVEERLADLADLRRLLAGGDVLSPAHVRRALERLPETLLVNGYGPTENTTFTCCHAMRTASTVGPTVAIGRPIARTRVYVVDEAAQPVGIGVRGELWTGGWGLARGYVGRPRWTAERFVPDAWSGEPGTRLYATGDLVRWRALGTLEFLGRTDHQLKIRGFRIEPGEVESALCRLAELREAVVTARDDGGGRRLVAYVVAAAGANPQPARLRDELRQTLPEHMVPSAFVVLPALPLDAHGKVDRRSLPAPEAAVSQAAYVTPRTPVEEMVAKIWSELLGIERPGGDDSFFELGGHSLLATRLVSRIRRAFAADFGLRQVFEHPTLAALSREIGRAMGRGEAPAIRPVPRAGGGMPLSFAQERLWFLEQLQPGKATYNVAAALHLRGRLDVGALVAALREVARRHEALRTVFRSQDERPVQVVLPDLPEVATAELGADELERRLEAEATRPFDLEHGPLLRAGLFRLGAEEHVLALVLHHIVADGWSLGIFLRELAALYDGATLAELPVQYADYAAWQREWLGGEVLERELGFWCARLAGAPEVLELPADRAHPAVRGSRGGTVPVRLSARLAEDLRALGQGQGATPFMVLLAGFQAVLSRLSGQRDVVVGTPIANRTRVEVEGLIGFFVNTLAVRTDLSGDPGFRELLDRVRKTTLEAYEHQELPFERLVEVLRPERHLGETPLVQVMFVLQNAPFEAVRLRGVEWRPRELATGTSKFDLTLALAEGDEGFAGALEYSADLFDRTTVQRLSGHWRRLLASAVAEPEAAVSGLEWLSPAERHQLVTGWNDAPPPPAGQTVHELFAGQAVRSPDAVAVVAGGASTSYGRLAAEAGRLAGRLRELGVAPEAVVGVCLERGLGLVTAILAILEAGGVYLPLDAGFPPERLALMLKDSGARLAVTREALAGRLPPAPPRLLLDRERAPLARPVTAGPAPENLAYVIYTSGSTGRPKGVPIAHATLVPTLLWGRGYFGLGAASRVLQSLAHVFDFGVFELLTTFVCGGTLHVLDDEELADPRRYARYATTRAINTVHATPSFIRQVLAGGEALPSLALLHLGGEALSGQAIDGLLAALPRDCVVYNGYGPTEATINSTIFKVGSARRRLDGGRAATPIGRRTASHRTFVLDRRLRSLPIGVPGELQVAGEGLTRGYPGRPALSAEKLVPDPYRGVAGARMYRTGDLVRALPDGNLEFLGRLDHQVKIRGFRIELGEIEAALARHPAVTAAVVAAHDAGAAGRVLAAWVEPAVPAGVRGFLAATLPDYMVPSLWVGLERLPLLPTGKVDRRALPAPELSAPAAPVTPRTPQEELLAGLWAEVLGRERVGVHDNFFDLGGHSLLATRLVSRIRRAFAVDFELRQVFEHPTLAALSREIDRAMGRGEAPAIRPAPRAAGGMPLSFAQERLWFLDRFEPGTPAYNMPIALRLLGELEFAALHGALNELAHRHESLRTIFRNVDGRPLQVIAPPGRTPLPWIDLTALDEARRHEEARRLRGRDAATSFDLERGPLFHGRLLRLADGEHVLLLCSHHVICDGLSLQILSRELGTLYEALARRAPSPLPELPVQYADYAVWQRQRLAGEVLAAQLDYWRRRLAGPPPALELPTDRPRPAIRAYRGARHVLELDAVLARRLEDLARRENATLFMTLLAAFKVLLSRLAGETDVVVGTPVAGRQGVEIEGLVGMFLNNLVLRTDLSGDPPFRELVRRVREVALGAYGHQDLPFERLLADLGTERDLSRTPLFQVFFNMLDLDPGEIRLPGLAIEILDLTDALSKFDLTVYVSRAGDGLRFTLVYNAELFAARRIAEMAAQYELLLSRVADRPEERVGRLSLRTAGAAALLPDPRAELSAAWEGAVHELVARQAARRPGAAAVVDADGAWTYGELAAASSGLAARLLDAGVTKGSVAAIYAHRSATLAWAVVGTLAAGAAFLILDPAYPAARLREILRRARPRVLLRMEAAGPLPEELESHLAETGCRRLDLPPWTGLRGSTSPALRHAGVTVGADDLACLAFTSGSTGEPKGIEGRHGPLTHFLPWQRERFGLGDRDRFSLLSGLAHDPLQRDLFTSLCLGGTLCIPDPRQTFQPGYLASWMCRHGITVAHLTPAMAQLLAERPPSSAPLLVPSLRHILLVGDVLTWRDVHRLRALAPNVRVVNLYGSTETQRAVGYHPVPPAGGDDAGVLPLGRGMEDVQLLVVNAAGELAGVGEVGEIWVRSPHLARGYLGDEELTRERFTANPFTGQPGDRVYRTGDLGRFLPDGDVAFAGRADRQVKVRGFRVELAEIEAQLGRAPGIRQAVVLARDVARAGRPERVLVAYLVPEGAGAAGWRSYLEERLPDYMVPSLHVELAALPLTPNGKVDRAALLRLDLPEAAVAYAAPRTPTEEILAGIWSDVLGRERIAVDESFFALGGHSLLATQVAARVAGRLGVELSLPAFFATPTVAALARRIDESHGHGDVAAVALEPVARGHEGAAELPLSFSQQRLWLLHQLDSGSAAYNMPLVLRLAGRLEVPALAASFADLAWRHEVLRTTFPAVDGRPTVRIAGRPPAGIPLVDLGGLEAGRRTEVARGLAAAETARPFDLGRAVSRVVLVRLGARPEAEEHLLVVTLHHIAFDGWSAGVLLRELAELYRARSRGGDAALPALPIQYADYAVWQRRVLADGALDRALDAWRQALAGAPPALDLPTDHRRPESLGHRGASHWEVLPASLAAGLTERVRDSGATLFMTLLAALHWTLGCWSGQWDQVVGTVVAGRERVETEGLIGCFMNFLPLRTRLTGEETGADLLARVREAVLAAYALRACPFDEVVAALRPRRSAAANPLYNVACLLQSFEPPRVLSDDLEASVAPLEHRRALLDLRLVAWQREGDALALQWEYSTDLFAAATIERLAAFHRAVLERLAAEPDADLAAVPLPAELADQAARARRRDRGRLVAIAATFTAEPVEETIRFWLDELELAAEVSFAPYNQVFQQLLDPSSPFGRNRDGANVVLVRFEDWLRYGEPAPEAAEARIEENVGELVRALRPAAERSPVPWLVVVCEASPEFLGTGRRRDFHRRMEEAIAAGVAGLEHVDLVTPAVLAALYPVAEAHDPHADRIGHVPYTRPYFTALGTMIARRLHGRWTPPCKVIALDCDQTLWQGVCGEDGALGVQIDAPRRALQELMVERSREGVLLCLCSKNDSRDVLEVFERRPEMPLKLEHLVAWRLNWKPKSENLRSLAEELGFGLDSFVFIDDNPVECAEVESRCPEVLTLLLPQEADEIPRFLKHVWPLDRRPATAEDARRTAMYREHREREALRAGAPSLAAFLAELELEIDLQPMAPEQVERVAQLTQRTNQFNVTTIRRGPAEVRQFHDAPNQEVLVAEVRDRFGDYGLVGVLMVRFTSSAVAVDTLLLSCRVLGRGVEHRLLARLGELARQRGLEWVEVPFRPTARNTPARLFLDGVGEARPEIDGESLYLFPAAVAAELTLVPAAERPVAERK